MPVHDPLVQALEDNVLKLCEQHPHGLTDQQIVVKLQRDIKPHNRINVYNRLLSKGRLRLAERQLPFPEPATATSTDGANTPSLTDTTRQNPSRPQVLYQWVSPEEAQRFRGLDASDRLVYDIIAKCGTAGATKRDMRVRTNIRNVSEVKQIVDRLMARRLVKEVKSVQARNKRIYILAELDPSPQHTGGPWYNDDQQYDIEFIDALYAQILAFLKRRTHVAYTSVHQVTTYLASIKLCNEPLAVHDIRTLMTTMLYDGVIEQPPCNAPSPQVTDQAHSSRDYFRPVVTTPSVDHLTSVPCGRCPLLRDCSPDGVISPASCIYISEWLRRSAVDIDDW